MRFDDVGLCAMLWPFVPRLCTEMTFSFCYAHSAYTVQSGGAQLETQLAGGLRQAMV